MLQHLQQSILRQDPSLDVRHAVDADVMKRRRKLAAVRGRARCCSGCGCRRLAHRGRRDAEHARGRRPSAQLGRLCFRCAAAKRSGRQLLEAWLPRGSDAGSLWSLSTTGDLTRIDRSTGKVLANLNTGVSVPCGLAVGEGFVWVTDCTSPTLVQIDPALDPPVVANRFPLPVHDYGSRGRPTTSRWAQARCGSGREIANPSYVHRLDPRTGHVEASVLIPQGGAQALTFGNGALWVANADIGQSRGSTHVRTPSRQPPVSVAPTSAVLQPGAGTSGSRRIRTHQIWKLDAQGAVTTSIALAGVIEELDVFRRRRVGGRRRRGNDRSHRSDDRTRNDVYRLGHHLEGVAAEKGVVAVGVQQSAQDVTAGLKGRIVHLALKDDYLDWSSPDPAAVQTAFNPYQVQFHYATCAKLFNYRDAPGAAGKQLVPEVAAGWPRVSDEGHTYTFRIRSGYRFSPPSNGPVTAASFDREIERVLSPRLQPGPWKLALLPDVVGAVAYHAGKSAHVSGVVFPRRLARHPTRQPGVRPPCASRRAGLLCGTRRHTNRVERHRVADPLRRPVLPRRTCGGCLRAEAKPQLPRDLDRSTSMQSSIARTLT